MNNEPLKSTFDYLHASVHTEEGWIHPLRDVVQGVTAEEAAWKPAPDVPSIWEIVLHTTPYLEDVLRALRSEAKVQHEDWPAVGEITNAAWAQARNSLVAAIDQLGERLGGLKESELSDAPAGRETARREFLADILVHDAYHAGQIVKLKQLYAARAAAGKEMAGAR